MNARRRRAGVVLAFATTGALALAACSSGFSSGSSASQSSGSGPVKLTVMIGSSGAAETNAVKAATAAWAGKNGNSVEVIAASDIGQQLGQAFASSSPPDVFYTDASKIGTYAKAGDLFAYGSQVSGSGFVPSLVQAFTYKGTFYCAPKDASTLALEINTDLWKAAGLTDADIPTTWQQLATVAKKLTHGSVTGLVIGNDINRSGAFMRQAGGWVVSPSGTMTASAPGNLQGLQEVQSLMKAGVLKFNTDTTPATGWGGEAFGKGLAAMTIEGNWLLGGMKDYPNIHYRIVELPAGPAGKGTLTFSNCWGIAAKSSHQAAAVALVKSLITPEQQMAFAAAFGVMPSTTQALAEYKTKYPQSAAFVSGADYGQGPVNLAGLDDVISKFNSQLATLSKGGDPAAMLQELQKNGTAALAG